MSRPSFGCETYRGLEDDVRDEQRGSQQLREQCVYQRPLMSKRLGLPATIVSNLVGIVTFGLAIFAGAFIHTSLDANRRRWSITDCRRYPSPAGALGFSV